MVPTGGGKLNIYEKLQECRVMLNNKKLKQTGFNKFSNYNYFELGDFIPQAMEIMKNLKLYSHFNFMQDSASLTIIDTEKPEDKLIFESPSVITEMKGNNPIQCIGASQTYMRRYLYMMVLELTESDFVNQTDPEANDEEAERQKTLKRLINEIELEAFQQAVDDTDTDIDALFKLLKYVGTPEQLTFGIWKEAMSKIQTKKEKMSKDNAKHLKL